MEVVNIINYPIKPIPKFITNNETGKKMWMRGKFEYPSNHGHCYWCGTEINGRRRSYCSDKHRWEYYNAFTWSRLREKILLRDGYRCSNCGLTQKRLEVDHIVAVSLGGEYFDPNNLRTLCQFCHKVKTRNDIRRLHGKPIDNHPQSRLNKFSN